MSFKAIKTNRLYLRSLNKDDWQMISFLRSDKTVNKFVQRSSAATQEQALAFIEKIHQGQKNKSFYYWVISTQDQPQMIGSICLWQFSEDRKTAEVGYDLHPSHQGKGIMSEALQAIINFGFYDLHLNNIEAYTQYDNTKSTILLEKHGFKQDPSKVDPENNKNRVYLLTKD
jgi:ribosomal-protein-alanine N-acetyltransferase